MNKWLKGLQKTLSKNQLVEICRNPSSIDNIKGYVVGVSEQFVLFHKFNDEMSLDGYIVVPVKFISKYREVNDNDYFATRALKIRNQLAKPQPKILLNDFPSLLESINKLFPLLTIHREVIDDSVCFIGKVTVLTEKTITLKKIDAAAKWYEEKRYNFKDITKIDFGGCYESALWLVSCQESGDKKLFTEALKKDKQFIKMNH